MGSLSWQNKSPVGSAVLNSAMEKQYPVTHPIPDIRNFTQKKRQEIMVILNPNYICS